jgi:hypothetical protein
MSDTAQLDNLIQKFNVNNGVETKFKNTIDKHQLLCASLDNDNCRKHNEIIKDDMNVLEKREKIWDHLNTLYVNNTDEQKRLYDKIKYNKDKLEEQKKELLFLKEKHSATKMGNSTHTRNIDMTKYERSRHNYYINLYITILLVNIGIICIMFLINYNIITPALFYIIISIVYLLLILYIIYYVYYSNSDRDYFYWDKFLFGDPESDSESCPVSLTADEIEAKKFNNSTENKIKDFVNNNSTTDNAPTTTTPTSTTPTSTTPTTTTPTTTT